CRVGLPARIPRGGLSAPRLYSAAGYPLSSAPQDDRPPSGDGTCGSEAMGEALRSSLPSINVGDPHLYQDDTRRPLFAQLGRGDPVHYCEASRYGPYWSVTRYDDIFAVELDHQNYSSANEFGGIQLANQPQGMERPNFIQMDPPGHTARRRTVA